MPTAFIPTDDLLLPDFLFFNDDSRLRSVSPAARFDPADALTGNPWQSATPPSKQLKKKTIVFDAATFPKPINIANALAFIARLKIAGFQIFLCGQGNPRFIEIDENLSPKDSAKNFQQHLIELTSFGEDGFAQIAADHGIARDKMIALECAQAQLIEAESLEAGWESNSGIGKNQQFGSVRDKLTKSEGEALEPELRLENPATEITTDDISFLKFLPEARVEAILKKLAIAPNPCQILQLKYITSPDLSPKVLRMIVNTFAPFVSDSSELENLTYAFLPKDFSEKEWKGLFENHEQLREVVKTDYCRSEGLIARFPRSAEAMFKYLRPEWRKNFLREIKDPKLRRKIFNHYFEVREGERLKAETPEEKTYVSPLFEAETFAEELRSKVLLLENFLRSFDENPSFNYSHWHLLQADILDKIDASLLLRGYQPLLLILHYAISSRDKNRTLEFLEKIIASAELTDASRRESIISLVKKNPALNSFLYGEPITDRRYNYPTSEMLLLPESEAIKISCQYYADTDSNKYRTIAYTEVIKRFPHWLDEANERMTREEKNKIEQNLENLHSTSPSSWADLMNSLPDKRERLDKISSFATWSTLRPENKIIFLSELNEESYRFVVEKYKIQVIKLINERLTESPSHEYAKTLTLFLKCFPGDISQITTENFWPLLLCKPRMYDPSYRPKLREILLSSPAFSNLIFQDTKFLQNQSNRHDFLSLVRDNPELLNRLPREFLEMALFAELNCATPDTALCDALISNHNPSSPAGQKRKITSLQISKLSDLKKAADVFDLSGVVTVRLMSGQVKQDRAADIATTADASDDVSIESVKDFLPKLHHITCEADAGELALQIAGSFATLGRNVSFPKFDPLPEPLPRPNRRLRDLVRQSQNQAVQNTAATSLSVSPPTAAGDEVADLSKSDPLSQLLRKTNRRIPPDVNGQSQSQPTLKPVQKLAATNLPAPPTTTAAKVPGSNSQVEISNTSPPKPAPDRPSQGQFEEEQKGTFNPAYDTASNATNTVLIEQAPRVTEQAHPIAQSTIATVETSSPSTTITTLTAHSLAPRTALSPSLTQQAEQNRKGRIIRVGGNGVGMSPSNKEGTFTMKVAGECLNGDSSFLSVRTSAIYCKIERNLNYKNYSPERFEQITTTPRQLNDANIKDFSSLTDANYYRFNLRLKANKKFRLLSASVDEEFVGVLTDPEDANITIEKGDDGFFYATATRNCEFSYVTKVDKSHESAAQGTTKLPASSGASKIISDYFADLKFSVSQGEATYNVPKYRAKQHEQWLEQVYNEKLGVCRHRVMAVSYKLHKDGFSPKKMRTVNVNGNHVILEIEHEGRWYSVDLGGGDNVKKILAPENQKYQTAPLEEGLMSRVKSFFTKAKKVADTKKGEEETKEATEEPQTRKEEARDVAREVAGSAVIEEEMPEETRVEGVVIEVAEDVAMEEEILGETEEEKLASRVTELELRAKKMFIETEDRKAKAARALAENEAMIQEKAETRMVEAGARELRERTAMGLADEETKAVEAKEAVRAKELRENAAMIQEEAETRRVEARAKELARELRERTAMGLADEETKAVEAARARELARALAANEAMIQEEAETRRIEAEIAKEAARKLQKKFLELSSTAPVSDLADLHAQFSKQENKKILVIAAKNLEEHANYFLSEAKKQHRPTFYIDSPASVDLDSSTLFIKSREATIKPTGLLAEFLESCKATPEDTPPLLMINWSTFNNRQKVALNTLLDRERSIGGHKIPDCVQVVSLCNEKPKDLSFLSRHDLALTSNLKIPQARVEEAPDVAEIDLQGFPNWRRFLFGRIELIGDKMILNDGPLVTALYRGQKNFCFKNLSPEAQKELTYEFNQAKACGHFSYHGCKFDLPEDVTISFADSAFAFESFDDSPRANVRTLPKHTCPAGAHLINTYLFDILLQDKSVADGQYQEQQGLLAKTAKGETLFLFISQPLSDSQWYCLFHQAKEREIELNLALAPKVELPSGLTPRAVGGEEEIKAEVETARNSAQIFISNDPQQLLAELDQAHSVIDVEDYGYQDFVERFDFERTESGFKNFQKIESELLEKLRAKEKIILKGKFAPDLLQMLHPLLAGQGDFAELAPNLTVILEDDAASDATYEPLAFLPHEVKNFTKVEKVRAVAYRETYDASELGEDSAERSADFIKERKDIFTEFMKCGSMLQMIGHSGVGKSRLMKVFEEDKDSEFSIHRELVSFDEWAKPAKEGKTKVLFIDESNIEDFHFTIFSPLKSIKEPKRILFRGKIHELSNQHKVVFARNPHEYGGGRFAQKLFEDGSIPEMHLADFSASYIYEQILKKSIYDKLGEEVRAAIPEDNFKAQAAAAILHYQKTNQDRDPKKHQTVRELQEDLLKFLASELERSQAETRTVEGDEVEVKAQRQQELRTCLESRCDESEMADLGAPHRSVLDIREERSAANPPFTAVAGRDSKQVLRTANFVQTNATTEAVNTVTQCLNIRFQQRLKNFPNRAVGTNGVLLEGDSGTGKSEMIRAILDSRGIRQANEEEQQPAGQNPRYWKIDANMPLARKREIIVKAFEAGDVIWIDELNSCIDDGLEKVLNAALTGTHPDTGRETENPGFCVLASVNQISLEGRSQISPALLHRMHHKKVPTLKEYKKEELQTIISSWLGEMNGADGEKVFKEKPLKIISKKLAENFHTILRLPEGQNPNLRMLRGVLNPEFLQDYVYGLEGLENIKILDTLPTASPTNLEASSLRESASSERVI